MSKFLPSVGLLLAILTSTGCVSENVKITDPTLGVADIPAKNEAINLFPGRYLSIGFSSDNADIDTSENLLQLRVSLIKDNEVVGSTIAMGPYTTTSNQILPDSINGPNYTAFEFQNLEFYSLEDGSSLPLSEVEFDRIEVQLAYPRMGTGFELLSNVISFSREDVLGTLQSAAPVEFR